MYIFYKIGENTPSANTFHMFELLMGKTMLYILSINVIFDDVDLVKYSEYLYSDKKFIAVFNHTSLVDPIVLYSIFERYSCVLLKNPIFSLCGYSDKIHKKLKNIFVAKNNTTSQILERVSNRKSGDSVLFIAPGAGNTPLNPDNITEFTGNGAFIGKYPILPIVLKLEDDSIHHNYDNGESYLHSIMKLFLLNNYKIKVIVGDMIEPYDNESIENYKNRTYNIMNDMYHKIKI
jgi:1-acyl-sn-glycerol-3-phosphate acyltransferase